MAKELLNVGRRVLGLTTHVLVRIREGGRHNRADSGEIESAVKPRDVSKAENRIATNIEVLVPRQLEAMLLRPDRVRLVESNPEHNVDKFGGVVSTDCCLGIGARNRAYLLKFSAAGWIGQVRFPLSPNDT